MAPRPWATREQVAAYYGITTKTLDRWRKRGYGPQAQRFGRLIRYRWEDVEDFAPGNDTADEEDDLVTVCA